jgi:hypothetical protein
MDCANRVTRSLRSSGALAALCCGLLMPALAPAEEGGSGHYLPGSMSSFADGVLSAPAIVARLNVFNYNGSYGGNRPLPIAGVTAVDVSADVAGVGLGVAWVPQWGVLDPTWTYQMSATVPVLHAHVSGGVQAQAGGGAFSLGTSDSLTGLGDIVLIPVMLNQNISPDININYRLAFYAPTGSYEVGRLANTGKNFWTVEPTIAFMYLGQQNGREASIFLGADFNQENPDTHYKTGTEVHVDSTFAQHFPWAGGLAGVGITAYWYQQVSSDSGSGASFGSFEAKTNGIGPVLSFVGTANGHKTLSELRWTHEYDVQKRLSGDTLFLKAMLFF